MTLITILQAAIFSWYVWYIWRRFGVLSSISASSYELTGNRRYLFFFWLVSLAILNWFQSMGIWGDLMSLGFVCAGLTIDHAKSQDLEDEIHTIGSIVAVAAGLLGLWFMHGLWEPAAGFVAGTIPLWLFARNRIWWIEILAMTVITAGYLAR